MDFVTLDNQMLYTEKCFSSAEDLFTCKLLGGVQSFLVGGRCCLGYYDMAPC